MFTITENCANVAEAADIVLNFIKDYPRRAILMQSMHQVNNNVLLIIHYTNYL